jgi:hypothetical protein
MERAEAIEVAVSCDPALVNIVRTDLIHGATHAGRIGGALSPVEGPSSQRSADRALA